MSRLFQPLLFLLARCIRNELIRCIEYLKAESEILREQIPKKRIFLSVENRTRLMKLGQAVGPGLKKIITVVSYQSFLRWVREAKQGHVPKKMGRPRTAHSIRELIVRLAKESGWGYTRVMGEIKKLGLIPPSKNTVKNILKAEGIDPEPKRGKGTWDEFLTMHPETLWQCDFFSKRIWTNTGLRQGFVLVFLHLGSRKVFVTKACFQPHAAWMEGQARAFIEHAKAESKNVEIVMRDRDEMYVPAFDDVLKEAGAKVVPTAHRAPNQNAFIERWIQSIQQECLDHFIVLGETHFNYLIRQYLEHYHTERPHQSLENKRLAGGWPDPAEDRAPDTLPINCHTRLGGLLRHDRRAA